jgi:feruloyl esterase
MQRLSSTALLIGVGFLAGNALYAQQAATTAPTPCENLKSVNFTNTTITGAETVAAGAFKPPVPGFPGLGADYSKLPAFCRVSGSIKPTADSDIRFDLWLPIAGWNGRFMQTGNGVAAGSIVYSSLAEPLLRGYAVANTDTGHTGAGDDFSWSIGHPEKLTDFAYRAVHELTVTGKAITAAYYGRAPEKSYFNGCSTGGRQGLMEAQRYPQDYDAIIAGAPANNWTALLTLSAMMENNMGSAGLGVDKLGVLKEAAIARCDALDGVADRVIADPDSCPFDPAATRCKNGSTGSCLSEREVAIAKRFYAGVVDSDGTVHMPGTGPGSEQQWAIAASPQFRIGTHYYRDVVLKDPDWQPGAFDVGANLPLAIQSDNGNITAMDPDLSAFIENGGKLILYHGTTDGLIPYGNTVNYYRSVVAKLGADRIKDQVRFYLVPGMAHCSGGDGAFVIDWLSAMEEWVEQGQAPGALRATRPDVIPGAFGAPPTTGNGFTRPACVYPEIARYQGSGDQKDAANFECAAP